MLRSKWSESKLKSTFGHHGVVALCLMAAAFACFAPAALAQGGTSEFTLEPASFNPDAVAPGGVSSSLIQVGAVNGFSGTVNLTCQVTSQQVATDPPVCTVSPPSVTAPGNAGSFTPRGVKLLCSVRLKMPRGAQVIFASSGGATYGEQDAFPAPETHPHNPLSPYGITNIDMPVTSDKVWAALRSKGVTE